MIDHRNINVGPVVGLECNSNMTEIIEQTSSTVRLLVGQIFGLSSAFHPNPVRLEGTGIPSISIETLHVWTVPHLS